MMKKLCVLVFLTLVIGACSDSKNGNSGEVAERSLIKAPEFSADSIYNFIQDQVDFGPRVPGTDAHTNAARYFVEKFEQFGAIVTVQEFEEQTYDGTRVQLKNIIAAFNPAAKKRILLAAHWDTRPFADKDPEDTYAPMDGANDGGSGVGVLLEVARIIGIGPGPKVGVDIILFDGEDWGEHLEASSVTPTGGKDSWWCLGSQYWSKNKHKPNYSAFYGILLDMVGAERATFYQDAVSKQNAQRVLDKVWGIANNLGHSQYFISQPGISLVDDHVYVNRDARIPMIDIIDLRNGGSEFIPEHHRQGDNMDAISKSTLAVVAELVLTVLYNE